MNPYAQIVLARVKEIGTNNNRPGSTAMCLQQETEMAWLAPFIAKLKPKTIVEIGIYKGGWQYIFAPWFNKGAHIIGIDSMQRHQRDNGDIELYAMVEKLKVQGFEVTLFETRSDDLNVVYAIKTMYKSIDLLHIDGAHSYEGAKYDWVHYSGLVRKGGLVVLHDVGTQTSQMNVKKLWEEIKEEKGKERTHELYINNGIGVVNM